MMQRTSLVRWISHSWHKG